MKSKHMVEKSENKNDKSNKKSRKLRITVIVLITVLIIFALLISTVFFYINNKINKLNIENITNNLNELGIDEANQNKDSQMNKYRNIAILGLDSRYDTYDPDYRTDCIMVARINKETDEVKLY